VRDGVAVDLRRSRTATEEAFHLFYPSTPLKTIFVRAEFRRSSKLPLDVQEAYNKLVHLTATHSVEIRWAEGDAFEEFGRYLREEKQEAQREQHDGQMNRSELAGECRWTRRPMDSQGCPFSLF
jgi:hypothetical protein